MTVVKPKRRPQFPQSQRDCVLQPKVARNELPCVNRPHRSQPQRGCVILLSFSRNPVGVVTILSGLFPLSPAEPRPSASLRLSPFKVQFKVRSSRFRSRSTPPGRTRGRIALAVPFVELYCGHQSRLAQSAGHRVKSLHRSSVVSSVSERAEEEGQQLTLDRGIR